MKTYHIHIGGLVQGVGFRPFVYRTALEMNIKGEVSNGKDGVHIFFNAAPEDQLQFYQKIISTAPRNAVITNYSCTLTDHIPFDQFRITSSNNSAKSDLLLTPDIAICPSCKSELSNLENRRYNYPFITCLECGPRYSITKILSISCFH